MDACWVHEKRGWNSHCDIRLDKNLSTIRLLSLNRASSHLLFVYKGHDYYAQFLPKKLSCDINNTGKGCVYERANNNPLFASRVASQDSWMASWLSAVEIIGVSGLRSCTTKVLNLSLCTLCWIPTPKRRGWLLESTSLKNENCLQSTHHWRWGSKRRRLFITNLWFFTKVNANDFFITKSPNGDLVI